MEYHRCGTQSKIFHRLDDRLSPFAVRIIAFEHIVRNVLAEYEIGKIGLLFENFSLDKFHLFLPPEHISNFGKTMKICSFSTDNYHIRL